MADDNELFTATFPAGRKQIFVDVKENNFGTYMKIKERGGQQTNSILIPSGSIVQLRNALDKAVKELGLEGAKKGGSGAALPPAPREAGSAKVCHVGNLSWETGDDQLRELFEGYGDIASCEVSMSKTGRSQGWGLVEFASAAQVTYAIEQCDGIELDGREIRVRADKGKVAKAPAMAKLPTPPPVAAADKVVDPNKCFCMNLSFDTTAEALTAHCASVGEVASVEMLTRGHPSGKNQRPSGSAVVEFVYAEAAAAAIEALENTELDGRDLRVRQYFSS